MEQLSPAPRVTSPVTWLWRQSPPGARKKSSGSAPDTRYGLSPGIVSDAPLLFVIVVSVSVKSPSVTPGKVTLPWLNARLGRAAPAGVEEPTATANGSAHSAALTNTTDNNPRRDVFICADSSRPGAFRLAR